MHFDIEESTSLVKRALKIAADLFTKGRLGEVELICRQILRVEQNTNASQLLGLVQYRNKQYQEAIKTLTKTLEINPTAENYNNLGLCYGALKDHKTAISFIKKALRKTPKSALFLANLGTQYRKQGRYKKAVQLIKASLKLKEDENVWVNLAGTYGEQKQVEKAIECLERAIEINGNCQSAHIDLAFSLHLAGRWEKAWKEYEHRLDYFPQAIRIQDRFPPERRWKGQPLLSGETLGVYCEQGIGDLFNFIRFLPHLREKVKPWDVSIKVEADEPLQELLRFSGYEVTDKLEVQDYTQHCSILSLPHLLKISETEIEESGKSPYLFAPRQAHLKFDELKVGIAWAGNPQHPRDEQRSCYLKNFRAIHDLPNVKLFSLQTDLRQRKWPGEEKIIDFSEGSQGMKVIDMSEHISSWADTAGIIAGLDLVITVDTAILHLAGAMGKKTWALLPYNPDWRWQLEGDTTPWYKTVRLVRQGKDRSWKPVFGSILSLIQTK